MKFERRNRTRILIASAATIMGLAAPTIAPAGAHPVPARCHSHDPYYGGERRPVDIVICLDTSGSMHHLLDSARARLWDVVNSLAKAKPTPRLRVGLFTYGSPSNSNPAMGWVVRQIDLTDNLDEVYAKMMAMTTNGGDEFVGWVLNDAIHTMSWSNDPNALKLIFVAGNESADQASEVYNFRHLAHAAKAKGITINSIYAGNRSQGIGEKWDEVAFCGGGSFSAIDAQCGTVQISTPQDKTLLELNLKLNATYVPYGDEGRKGEANQRDQDENAQKMGVASAADRVAAKSTELYTNAGWDLVDAFAEKKVKVEEMKEAELPPVMQSMTVAGRKDYLEQQVVARRQVRREIENVSESRSRLVKKQREASQQGKVALDDAMVQTLIEQAKAKGFVFE